MLNLNSIMLGSSQPEALVEFYGKILGKPSWEDQGFVGWQVGASGLMIGPHSEVKGKNSTPGRILWNFETADVEEEFARIRDLGAKVVQEPYEPGGDMLMATFEDPDGNYFQLATPYKE